MSLKFDLNVIRDNPMQFEPTLEHLDKWAAEIAQRLEEPCHISVTLVEPDHIQELNKEYRGKDYATNVLSFPFQAEQEDISNLGYEELGDIIICPEVLEREAKEQDKQLEHHWTHIVIHGILHLLGYDHIEEEEAQEMESLEKQLLATLGIPDPYRDDEDSRDYLD